MIEILPIRVLTEEDSLIFGSLNVSLGKLYRVGFPVGDGIVVTAPNLKLRTTLEQFDFGAKEVFKQSLELVKKEINSVPIPQILAKEVGKHKRFFLDGMEIKGLKKLWLSLLGIWLESIKLRLWNNGFYPSITEKLDPQVVIFTKDLKSLGVAFYDDLQNDVVVQVKMGKLSPNDLKKIDEVVNAANKKLFLPSEYEWIIDNGVKLVGIKPSTPNDVILGTPESSTAGFWSRNAPQNAICDSQTRSAKATSAVRVLLDLSGAGSEKGIDGVYIASEKIFDLNKPSDSFEKLILMVVDSAITLLNSPVFLKLADKSEGMGKVRGALRLLHQKSLLDPLIEALDFVRYKKGLENVHIVIPFVRTVNELSGIKKELAAKKLTRKSSLQIWMEVAVPENIINLEDYLSTGVDGVVLNLDEQIAYLNGFDQGEGELIFYKNEISGLVKFLEEAVRILHKFKIPFIAYGSLTLHPKVLEFLVEKGVWGVVMEKYEAHSGRDLLYQAEKRMILHRAA